MLIGLVGCTAIMIGFAYHDTTQELHGLFTDNLRRMAVVIRGQAFPQSQLVNGAPELSHEELEESYVIQIWNSKGALIRSSTQEINLPLQHNEGLGTQKIGDSIWQIYTLKVPNAGFIQIAQPKEIVATMVGESAFRTLTPFIVLLLMLSAGAWYVVGRSLSPLSTLSQTIARWEATQMRPLPIFDAPQEVQPVVTALNSLLAKLGKAMNLQRQFTADAAHELRTPLTAIKVQLDLLKRAQSDRERDEALNRLSEGIDRSIHLASQLLSASRSMAVKTMPDFQPVKLNEIIRSCMATFVALASGKNIEIAFEAAQECRIKGDEESLRVLVNNLMDNAVRYTPANGKIDVRLFREDQKAILEVSDNGPGIPEVEKNRIFQRFYRVPGTASTGSGLGLSIVKNIAESHGAGLQLSNGIQNKGATFRVAFNLPNSDNAISGAADA
ncbi:MAG: ATP-binding protein [Alphaproteobacteria bacterium]|nr:ATP-binding protein [Alphaproteobacteria bacterium]